LTVDHHTKEKPKTDRQRWTDQTKIGEVMINVI